MKPPAIRPEESGDEAAIGAVITAAFAGAMHSDGTEAALVDHLRQDQDLTISLVAQDSGGAIIGHVAFSPVTIADGTPGWYGLGPVSVAPAWQGKGIGTALIREGFARLGDRDAQGCVVLGDPGYYGRFGFTHDPQLAYPGPPPTYFQRVVLQGPAPTGDVRYAAAFG